MVKIIDEEGFLEIIEMLARAEKDIDTLEKILSSEFWETEISKPIDMLFGLTVLSYYDFLGLSFNDFSRETIDGIYENTSGEFIDLTMEFPHKSIGTPKEIAVNLDKYMKETVNEIKEVV